MICSILYELTTLLFVPTVNHPGISECVLGFSLMFKIVWHALSFHGETMMNIIIFFR